MSLKTRYPSYYDATFQNEPISETLRDGLSRRLFTQPTPMAHPFRPYVLRASLAALALLISFPIVAPSAFASAVRYSGDAISLVTETVRITVTRAFNPDADLVSDETVTDLSSNPSVSNLEYVRDESGELLRLEQTCDGDGCDLSLPSLEINTDEEASVNVEIRTDGESSTATITKE